MSRYYIIHQGERFYKQSVKEIAKLAQRVADEMGGAVAVYEDTTGLGFGGKKKGAMKPVKKRGN